MSFCEARQGGEWNGYKELVANLSLMCVEAEGVGGGEGARASLCIFQTQVGEKEVTFNLSCYSGTSVLPPCHAALHHGLRTNDTLSPLPHMTPLHPTLFPFFLPLPLPLAHS